MPLAILFGAFLTVAVSLALGSLFLRDACPDWGIRFVTGAALLSFSVFAFCALGIAYPAVFLAFALLLLILARRHVAQTLLSAASALMPTLFFLPYFILYFFNSMAPEISFDGSRYHLGLVGRYFREHGFHPITDNLYASLSQGVEMLFLYAYAFGRHSAAAMVHFAFLVALAWLMFHYARRTGFPKAGAVAAALVFASPMVGVDASSAYNDVAVAAIAFALFSLLQLWDEQRSPRLLLAAGLMAGFAFAAKYTAWMAIPYALGFVAWKSRRARDIVIVAACAAAMVLPWMVKNWAWVGNPLAPFFNAVFPNPYFTVAFERDYRHYVSTYGRFGWADLPLQATVHGSLAGVLGPVFLLAPVGLLALRRREGRQLLLAAAIFSISYFSNISTRFLIPSLPFVALAMGLALRSVPRLALGIVVLHAVLSWPDVLRRYSAPDAWRLAKVPFREALRIKPEDGFLQSNLPYYGVTRMVEEAAAPGSAVLVFTPIPEAYTSRRILVTYQSAENTLRQKMLFTGFVPEYAPTWELRFSFPRQTLRGVRIVQTNTGADLWNLHELRLFDGAVEWPRGRGWRLTARPDRWRLESLLDGNPVTFWVSGESLRPGQFVEAAFDRPAAADSLRVLAAPNQWNIRLKLEGRDISGAWRPLASAPEMHDRPAPAELRRMAARQLKRSGVDYVLMFDSEFGAADLRDNAELWGIRQVAEFRGARLYQLP